MSVCFLFHFLDKCHLLVSKVKIIHARYLQVNCNVAGYTSHVPLSFNSQFSCCVSFKKFDDS